MAQIKPPIEAQIDTQVETPVRKSKFQAYLRRLRRGKRGQAMMEYAVVVTLMLGSLVTAGMIFLPSMIRAYNIYYKSFYAVLNLPIP
jgi:Flp pilus assembly pilin Flp